MSDLLVLVTSRGLCQVAGLAWFFYDWLLALDDEVEHVWFRNFNFTTLLYINSRLLSVVMLVIGAVQATRTYELTPAQCEIFHWLEAIGTMLIFFNTQLVLQYRLWAIYNRSRKILLINGILFFLELGAAIVVCALYYANQPAADILTPAVGLQGETCTTVPQRKMALIFLSVVVYELWLVALVLYRTIQVRHLLSVSGHRSLTEVLAFDSVMYFGLIFASVIAVVLVWIFAPLYPGNAAIAFTRAACGIGASRLILHMRCEVRTREEHSYSHPDCIGVSLVFNNGSGHCPEAGSGPSSGMAEAKLVKARPSWTSTDGYSPRPSVASQSTRAGSRSTRPSIASGSGGHSPRPSVASGSISGRPSLASGSRSFLDSPASSSASRPSLSSLSVASTHPRRSSAGESSRRPSSDESLRRPSADGSSSRPSFSTDNGRSPASNLLQLPPV